MATLIFLKHQRIWILPASIFLFLMPAVWMLHRTRKQEFSSEIKSLVVTEHCPHKTNTDNLISHTDMWFTSTYSGNTYLTKMLDSAIAEKMSLINAIKTSTFSNKPLLLKQPNIYSIFRQNGGRKNLIEHCQQCLYGHVPTSTDHPPAAGLWRTFIYCPIP